MMKRMSGSLPSGLQTAAAWRSACAASAPQFTPAAERFCYDSRMSSSRHAPSSAKIVPSALDLVGNTSLVALDRIRPGLGRILAKAEFMQPGGSVKDRAARSILLAARADGRLALGAPVIEMTSGNMGAGLAVACAALGYPLLAAVSAGSSPHDPGVENSWSIRLPSGFGTSLRAGHREQQP